jgi:TetR/AcrR family acrAB operon transcriptional repressor
MPRRTKEEAEITRQRLLDAALSVFSRQGYAATKLEDVAAEAEVTRGAIYWHFGSKAELYLTLIRERAARVEAKFEEIINSPRAPLEKLWHLLTNWLEFLEDDADYRAVQELTLFKTELVPELETGIDAKNKAIETMRSHLSDLIRAGIEAKEIRPDIEPDSAALAALGLVNGLGSMWLLNRKAFSIKDRAGSVVDIFIQGIVR